MKKINNIITPRLLIRLHQYSDAQQFLDTEMASRNELQPWFSWAKSETIVDVKEYFKYLDDTYQQNKPRQFHFFIFDKQTEEFLGTVNYFRVDWDVPYFYIAYWLKTSHTGKGLMTEAVNAVTQMSFLVYNARRVQISASVANVKSLMIPKRLNFTYEGTLRNYAIRFDTNEATNSEMYACCDPGELPKLEISIKLDG